MDVTGPACRANAVRNVMRFVDDLAARGQDQLLEIQLPTLADPGAAGRWPFVLTYPVGEMSYDIEVRMPGLPLDQVRWLGDESGSIWNFTRLLIGEDGSSWIWALALECCGLPELEGCWRYDAEPANIAARLLTEELGVVVAEREVYQDRAHRGVPATGVQA